MIRKESTEFPYQLVYGINHGIFMLVGIMWQLHCFFQRHRALIANLITTWREFQHSFSMLTLLLSVSSVVSNKSITLKPIRKVWHDLFQILGSNLHTCWTCLSLSVQKVSHVCVNYIRVRKSLHLQAISETTSVFYFSDRILLFQICKLCFHS